jgi:hypothetical protein
MTEPGPQTTVGRIAALEARQAELEKRLEKFEREVLGAVSFGDPPKRSPESTTSGSFTIRNTANLRTTGFGKDVTA